MDALAAAAAVVDLPTNEHPGDNSALGSTPTTVSAIKAGESSSCGASVESVSAQVIPSGRDLQATNPKVANATILPRSLPETRPHCHTNRLRNPSPGRW